jgi:hypothetical protein
MSEEKAIDKSQKCEYCEEPASKGYIWAEHRAYIPVSDKHKDKAKKQIEEINKDEISGVRDIPQKKSAKVIVAENVVRRSARVMNPRKEFEQVIAKQASVRKAFEESLERYKQAIEFPTEKAREDYLKKHPGADRAKHTVKEEEKNESSSKEESLPKDLSKLTEGQHKKVIDDLAKKPLKELRKKQDLINSQLEIAHKKQDSGALKNLRIMQKHVDSAVNKKEFGE